MNYSHATESQQHNPTIAAALSVIPGLGQIYNLEPRKGLLFLLVGFSNLAVITSVVFLRPLVSLFSQVGQELNIRPNTELVSALSSFELGSPASLSILTLFLLFSIYVVRDAHDHARAVRYKELYRASAMHFSEASSGSYLFHLSLMATMLLISFFFLIPPIPKPQITTIEFIQTEAPPEKVKVKTNKVSTVTVTAKRDPRLAKSDTSASAHSSSRASATKQTTPARTQVKHTESPAASRVQTARRAPAQRGEQTQIEQPSRPTQSTEQTKPARVNPKPMLAMIPATSVNMPKPMLPLPIAGSKGTAAPSPILSRTNIGSALPAVPSLQPVSKAVLGSAPNAPAVKDVKLGGGPATAPSPSKSTQVSDRGEAPQPVPVTGSERLHSRAMPLSRFGPVSQSESNRADSPGGPEVAIAPSRSRRGRGSGPIPGLEPSIPRGRTDSRPEGTTDKGNIDRATEPTKAVDPDFSQFMADLQRRIKRSWFPPKGPTQKTVLRFSINQNGTMSDLKLQTSSGISTYDQAALTAVKNAAPFRRLPEGAPSSVNVEFTFDYKLYNGGTGSMRRF